MKKLISVVVLITVLISLTACGAGKPEDKVSEFFIAAQKFDTAGMDACVIPTAIAETTQADDVMAEFNEFADGFMSYMIANASKLTYKVTSIEMKDDKAVVTAECRFVDGSEFYEAVMQDYFIKYAGRTFWGQELSNEEKIQLLKEIMDEQLNTTAEKYKDITLKIDCIKKDKSWFIAELTDDMKNAISSNFDTYLKEIESGELDSGSDESLNTFEDIFADALISVFDTIDQAF